MPSKFAPMANCSIPNSSPATGRTSTRSLRRSRKQNRQPLSFVSGSRHLAFSVQKRRQAAAFQSVLSARKIRHWMLDVERWEFSALGRVKGAWWPSRSSKPSSPRKWRGRFDSYPLRQISLVIRTGAPSLGRHRRIPWPNGISAGLLDLARNDESERR